MTQARIGKSVARTGGAHLSRLATHASGHRTRSETEVRPGKRVDQSRRRQPIDVSFESRSTLPLVSGYEALVIIFQPIRRLAYRVPRSTMEAWFFSLTGRIEQRASIGGAGAWHMATNLETVVTNYLRARTAAQGTRDAYSSTVRKWGQWGKRLSDALRGCFVNTDISTSRVCHRNESHASIGRFWPLVG
jgi:hypothetical protein